MVAVAGGEDIKCSKYATFGTKNLSRNIIKALKNRTACLIANHGQVAFGEKFIELARNVYKFNDERAKIKFEINQILGSSIKEVKSHF